MKLFLRLLFILILLVAGVAGAFYWHMTSWYADDGPSNAPIVLQIEPGTGFRDITRLLITSGVLEDEELLFNVMAFKRGDQSKVKAGEYEFDAGITPKAAMDILVKGESIQHAVTVPEGLTVREIQLLLMSDTRLTGPLPMAIAEGTLMPDTYHIHRGDSREALVERMRKKMQKTLQEEWEKRQEGLPLKTPAEALVLASVIEKETGVDAERGRVSAVFVNRLHKGMPLQSDPTVVYGIELEKGPMGRPLWLKDLKIDHPYNTYVHNGLPPAPIANPGRAAIHAALNPPKTNEYYFVATGHGGHYFSKTLAEHNRNVAKYRKVQRQKAK